MDYFFAAFLGFIIGGILWGINAYEKGQDRIQESCLIKQEFTVDETKFKCELIKE